LPLSADSLRFVFGPAAWVHAKCALQEAPRFASLSLLATEPPLRLELVASRTLLATSH